MLYHGKMIIESIIGGITIITLSSMWFANSILKREAAQDEPPPEPEKPKVYIEPYKYPSITLECPMCGVKEQGSVDAGWGPPKPTACTLADKCEAYPARHVHADCGYCKAKWFRAAKDH